MFRFFAKGFAAALFLSASAQQSLGDTQGTHDYPASHSDIIRIGVPFDTVKSKFLASDTCVEGYKPDPREGSPGGFDKRLLQVSNTLDLMRTLNINVAASAEVFGGGVSGKMGFTHSSDLSQTSLNYALYAHYQGAPKQIDPKDGEVIRLTKKARHFIEKQGEDKFREKCGDAYVRIIFTGAQAYAVLTFLSTDQATRDSISTAMQAKGAGWKADIKVDAAIKTQSASGKLQITYSQIGGPATSGLRDDGAPVDTDWAQLKSAIEGINRTTETVTVGFQVQPYDAMQSWKWKKLTPSANLIRLAYYRAAYNTMLNTIEPLIAKSRATEFSHVMGRNQNGGAGDQDTLSQLQSDLLANRKLSETLYGECSSWRVKDAQDSQCADTDILNSALNSSATDPYKLMARLPLQMADPANPVEAFFDKPSLVKAVFQQNHITARNSYCQFVADFGHEHPGCMDIPALRSAYMPHIKDAITDIWYPAPGGYQIQSLFRRDATCLTAHPKSSDDKVLFMQTCASEAQAAKQRFAWRDTGQLRIRESECVAGPHDNNGGVSPHNCRSREARQLWRFIPTDRDASSSQPGTKGVLQEAGFGRCLIFGTPAAGKKTYVRAALCNMGAEEQQWTFRPK